MARLSFPHESDACRAARNRLLDAETGLGVRIGAVAAGRQALPPGGAMPEDHVSGRIGANQRPELVRMSELFGPHDTLIRYSFMYGPERDTPCRGCTRLVDSLDGAGRQGDTSRLSPGRGGRGPVRE